MSAMPAAPGNGTGPVLSAPLPVDHERDPVLVAPFGLDDIPPAASARALLRRGLPAIYREPDDGFAMRFLEALEHVLDPRVAVIDCRASYLDCDLAPEGMVREMASWLGFEPEQLPAEAVRRLLANANQIARSRGTKKGIELALICCFPSLHLEVEDGARPRSPSTPEENNDEARLVVRCREALAPGQRAALALVVDRQCPVHVEPEIRDGDPSVADDAPHEIASWLGLELERVPAALFRRVLASASRLAASRGTREGLELALTCLFEDLHFRVEEAEEGAGRGRVVRCRETLLPEQRASVERFLSRQLALYGELELIDGDPSVKREEKQ
jgi:phage tail-like protein